MFLQLLVICLVQLARCEEYLGSSIAAIGPDTFGYLPKYQAVLSARTPNYQNNFSIEEYLLRKGAINKVETDMLLKYKEVNAILFSTSRFYYNYRHVGNVAVIEANMHKLGLLPRRQTVSMIPETCLCHPTNTYPGRIYVTKSVDITDYKGNIMNDDANTFLEHMYVAYRSMAVQLHNLRYVMTQRFPKKYPQSSRVFSKYRVEVESIHPQIDMPSHFVYMTGHGGDRYFQFQAKDVIAASNIELYVNEFVVKHPNAHSFLVTDTCQASTLFESLTQDAPMIWAASSSRGISSYSHNANTQLTVSTVGKFTYYVAGFIESVIMGIKGRGDRASVSRFSLTQLNRHMMRHCPEELPVFHANARILEANQSGTEQSSSNVKNQSSNMIGTLMCNILGFHASISYRIDYIDFSDARKVYLGEFLFNYRLAYFNAYRWMVGRYAKETGGKPLEGRYYEAFNVNGAQMLLIDGSRLYAKMGESGLLLTIAGESSRHAAALIFSICLGALLLTAVCDPLTMGSLSFWNVNV
ncbi:GPI-anchor transamidase [Babesia ovis]|uniref:GPI-anchor transamidase n=1 Tax=Babesia ovis TaxID=5869 RepID=A0A9W5T806_BABOV|nr:GPI-anchor transamidase [Babesia ovis]